MAFLFFSFTQHLLFARGSTKGADKVKSSLSEPIALTSFQIWTAISPDHLLSINGSVWNLHCPLDVIPTVLPLPFRLWHGSVWHRPQQLLAQ